MADSWSTWGKPIMASIVTSVIVYLQITFFTLSASYFMNRSIYRSGAIRALTGILAGLTAVVTFWVVLFLPKTPYFGMFPVLGPMAGDPQWGWLNYFRSSYASADAGIIEGLVRSSLGWKKYGEKWVNTSGAQPVEYVGGAPPTEGVVNEARGLAAREAGAKTKAAEWAAAFAKIGGIVAAVPAALGSVGAASEKLVTRAVRGPASASAGAASRGTEYWDYVPNPLGQFYYYHDNHKYNKEFYEGLRKSSVEGTPLTGVSLNNYVESKLGEIVNKFTEVNKDVPPESNIQQLRKHLTYYGENPTAHD